MGTPILNITLVAPSQANKETTINDGFAVLEASLNQALAVNMTSGDVDLTTSPDNFRHNFALVCSGHTVARNLTVPNQVRYFCVRNNGTGPITVKAGGASVTYSVAAGDFPLLYSDGADHVYLLASPLAVGSISPSFIGLTDAPHSYTGQGGKGVRVNAGATGLEFYTITTSYSRLQDLTDVSVSLGAGVDGYHLYWNNGAGKFELQAAATTIAGMTDVTLTSLANGNVLQWNGTKWVNVSPSAAFTARLDGLGDVNVTEGAGINSYALTFDQASGKWVATQLAAVAFSGAYSSLSGTPTLAPVATSGLYSDLSGKPVIPSVIDDLSDVTITTPAVGDLLEWNGTAWVNRRREATYDNGNVSGAVSVDFRNGETQILTLTGNVTSFTVTNWPGGLGKLTLIIKNTGAFTFTWPTAKWPGAASAPIVTSGAGKEDWYVLATVDAGTNLRGFVAAQNFG